MTLNDPKPESRQDEFSISHIENGDQLANHSKFPSLLNFLIVLTAAISSFLFGYGNNAVAGSLAQQTFLAKFLSGPDYTAIIDGIESVFFGGGFIGTVLQGAISDKFGRKICAETAAILMIISGVLSAASVNPAMFIVSRGFCGLSADIAPHARGLLVGMHATFITIGYITCGVFAVIFNFVTSSIQWRLQFIMLIFFSVVCAITILILPESPRWYVEQGKKEEALAVMERLHRTKSDPTAKLARAEFHQIVAQVEEEKKLPHSWWYIFSNAHLRRRAYCSILAFAMVQSSGLLVIFNLMPILFASLGFDNLMQLGLSVVWVTCATIGASVNSLIVDRVGRVTLLVIGGYLCTIAMAIQCALQKYYLHSDYKPGINACVAFFYIFILFYAVTCDATVYVYNAEIWPTHLRSKGVTFGLGSYFIFGIVYSSPASQAFDQIEWRYYLVFICATFVAVNLIWLTFPETKGLSLEEVNIKFGDTVQVALTDIRVDPYNVPKPYPEKTENDSSS
ncbi:general substrate transporter [Myxozyma melibiosi]|uniref:General substrate transporter n=1 Tax=Myxozyma melibiosi TaxID=54550 RepID=A0ABR1EYP0_9ASCO